MNLNQSATALLAEVKTNPRLRWGLWTIVGVLWFYGVLELRDAVQGKNDSYLALGKKVMRMKETAGQSEWPSRLRDTQSLQLNLESRLWRENTIGLAQATFHDWLNQLAQQANLTKVQLVVAVQDGESAGGKESAGSDGSGTRIASDLWKVSAKLNFDFNPQSLYPFLTRISTHERKVAVESLVIRSTPTPKAELMLVAYFRKPVPGVPAELGQKIGRREG
ncbi:MAG: hypothetical protein A3G25_20990 [Betaproteobacteria bacterium RIFCSPLOWO2_12_FULL_63_13]|nr:MAG: hypothetical protein A3G25_20990 [Betaproteobacteria bacterium RIFCSPLOWO2_12_FULL_63_13]